MNDSVLDTNPIKSKKWQCIKCRKENPGHSRECSWCGHEPVMGRSDNVGFQGRKFTPVPEGEDW